MVAAFVTCLWAWQSAAHGDELFLRRWGSPTSILMTLVEWVLSGYLWPHLWSTVSIAILGLVIGGLLGVSLAYVFHQFPSVGKPLTPLMAWLNSLPRILLVPFFIALIGIGYWAKLTMVVAMTVFLFFFNTLRGIEAIDPRMVANARLLGARGIQVAIHVQAPLLASWVLAVLRPALGFSFIGAIISEYFGSVAGLGYIVDNAYGMDSYGHAIAGLIVIFVLVGLFDSGIRLMEKAWFKNGAHRGESI